jgi:hypothetical protein
MQTRESIVQRLFNEGLITAEEAVVLLKTEVIWLPSTDRNQWIGPGIPSYPAQPYTPMQPHIPNQPINVPYCDWRTDTADPVTFTTTASHGFGFDLNKNYTEK